ncbi:DMT family transporter [Vibrio mexicanus]|uniref:DMT family transporter n=1 Tax=Vibrio mexicanus TaxID=1004326 RepID=UPI00063CAF79|nr:DMT family transporter [Vibrio mexicanus]
MSSQSVSLPRKLPITEGLLLLVAIVWGTSYGVTKSALFFVSIPLFLSLRFFSTFVCLIPALISDYRNGNVGEWWKALPTGAILAGIFSCEVIGVSLTSASNAAFLISLSMIFTAVFERVINQSKPSPVLMTLSVGCLIGVGMLTWQENRIDINVGDGFILLAAVLRGIMVTTTKRFTEGSEISTLAVTAIQSFVVGWLAFIAFIAISPLSNWELPSEVDFWLMLGYLVVFCTLFAFAVQNFAVRRLSPTKVSMLMGSEPLFGALFAAWWLQESMTLIQILGGALICFCVVKLMLSPKA